MEKSRQTMLLCILSVGLLFAAACSESGMSAEENAEIPAGTQLYVRVDDVTQDSGITASNEFRGTLERPVELNGRMIVPAGTLVKGEITEMDASGYSTGGTTAAPDDAAPGMAGDPSVPGTDAAAGRAASEDRMGLELQSIVLNGKDYDIQTHAVPGPESAVPGDASGSGVEGTDGQRPGADAEVAKLDIIKGKQFVFTLEDSVELPAAETTSTTTRSE